MATDRLPSAPVRQRVTSSRHRVLAAALFALVVALVSSFGTSTEAQAVLQEKSWTIDRLDVVLEVLENGDVVADETWTYDFTGNFHWIERDIPLDAGEGVADIAVRGSDGTPLPESDSGEPGTFYFYEEGDTIWVHVSFDITDASATYTFHYRTKSLVNFGRADDQVVWYLLSGTIDVPIGELRATVKLPGSVPSEDLLYGIDADYGLEPLVYSPGPSTLVYEASDIWPYAYLYTRTGFPKGVVTHHWTAREVASFIVPKVGFFLPIATFLAVFLIWFRRGRDEPSQVFAKYVSEPPSDLSPGLVGALIDEKVDTKEVMATIIDLARRGYLEISEGDAKGTSGKSGPTFTRLKQFGDLQGFEKTVAEALFDSSHPDEVTASQLKNHFYVHVGPIVGQIYEEVATAGYFKRNPNRTRKAWFAYGFIFIGIAAFAYWVFPKVKVDGYGYLVAGAIFSAIVVWIFSSRMPGRTAKGSGEQRKWEAFRNYLQDLTRFQDMEAAKEKYEESLPYAIALGVEKQWTRRFEDMTVAPPDWYHPPIILTDTGRGTVRTGGLGGGLGGGFPVGTPSGGGFSLDKVSSGLFGALNKVSSAMTSAPSSSSGGHGAWGGGGFSGGGFSGGGFSGGGFSGGGGGGGMRAG